MRILIRASVAIVLSLGAASLAHAQSTRRPDLNLFGRGLRDPQQSLGVSGSLGATFYDQLRGPTFFNPDGTQVPTDGWGAFGSGSLNYNLRLANVTIDGRVGGFATYYPNQPDRFRTKALPGAGANAAWSWDLTRKTHLSVGTGLRLRPLGQESILPGGFGTPAGGAGLDSSSTTAPFLPQEAAFVEGTYLSFVNNASLTHELSRRFSLSGDYAYRRDVTWDVDPSASEALALWDQTAAGALHFAVTRNLSVHGGWRMEESHSRGADRPVRTNNADIGVDYGRGAMFRLTRRTTLTFGGNVSGYVDKAGSQHYRLGANASLVHEIARTWSSSITYTRGLDAAELLYQEPLLTDTATAQLNGLLSRWLGFHASMSAQRGAVGFTGVNNGLTRVQGNTGLQTALGRHLALSVDYSYYRYHFDSGVPRPVGLSADSASQGIQVYLSAWAPIFQQRGRPNATR